jgi:hypothetical protein
MQCGYCGALIELEGTMPPICAACSVPVGLPPGLSHEVLTASVGQRVRVYRRAPGGGEGGRVLGRLEHVSGDGYLHVRLTAKVVAILHVAEVASVEELPE